MVPGSLFLSCSLLALFQGEATHSNLIPTAIVIEAGGSRAWEFPAASAGQVVSLEIRSRMNAATTAGSTFWLRIFLNDAEIRPSRRRDIQRLRNKPLITPVAPNLPAPWYGEGGWRVVYGSDFETPRRQSFYQGDPCTLDLDLTDLVRRDGANQLRIVNTAGSPNPVPAASTGELVIGALVLRRAPASQAPERRIAPTPDTPVRTGSPEFSVLSHAGGGFSIRFGERLYRFTSSFSDPNSGWNRLRVADEADPAGWRVTLSPTGQPEAVVAVGADYQVRRTFLVTPHRVEVADTITNTHADAPLGLMVRHELSLAGLRRPTVRLAGNPDPELNDYHAPGNPSVHVATSVGGLGLLCEDDVFRNQARLYYADPMTGEPPVVGLRTDMLRLAPGETCTLRWSVYPASSANYEDFINRVREDWGANTTVEGAWLWGYEPDSVLAMSDGELRAQFNRCGIRVALVGGGWIDPKKGPRRIGFGAEVLDEYWADFRRRIRESATKIRRACPGTRVLVYYNTQRDTSSDAPTRYPDSLVTAATGQVQSTSWNGRFNTTYSMIATLENSFGKAMLQVADRYMEELGADGLYWDEMESTGFGVPELTYSLPDGHSCLIDPRSHRISADVGMTTLLGRAHRLAVLERVRKKGGMVLGNGPACTRAILDCHVQRMVEIQHNDIWAFEGNLQTPLGYLSGRKAAAETVRALEQLCLPVAQGYEGNVTRRLFPFTPIALHRGHLIGQERIIATRPGSYGWTQSRSLVRAYHFDPSGQETNEHTETRIGRYSETVVTPGPGEIVILERLPLTVDPTAGKILVSQVRYTEEDMHMNVHTGEGGILRVGDASTPLKEGTAFLVTAEGQEEQQRKSERGVLAVPLKPGFVGTIRIRRVSAPGQGSTPGPP